MNEENDLLATVLIKWDRKGDQVHWDLAGLSYLEAMWILTDIARRCAEFAQAEAKAKELASKEQPYDH